MLPKLKRLTTLVPTKRELHSYVHLDTTYFKQILSHMLIHVVNSMPNVHSPISVLEIATLTRKTITQSIIENSSLRHKHFNVHRFKCT